MSQSDYIKFKKTATKISIDNRSINNKEPAVFESGNYTDFKQFNLENTINNTSPTFNYIVPTGHQIVFGMDKVVSSCPGFIDCIDTNVRPNRVPMSTSRFTPTPSRLNWNALNTLNKQRFLDCKCDTSLYRQ
jgi:hypothetical protein